MTHLCRALAAALTLSLSAGCVADPSLEALSRAGSLDDVLRVNQLQCKGTHNSFHIQSWFPLPQYQYTNLPLDAQAETEGVRQVELDLHYNGLRDRIDVFHVVVIDRRTTCDTLTGCLEEVVGWSDEHPDHQPFFILLEPKTLQPGVSVEHFLEKVEESILAAMPVDRIITPDEVQGGYGSLPRALAAQGWPTLADTRGRFLFALDNTSEVRESYTYGGQDLHDRLMFVKSSPGEPFGAFVFLNDPVGSQADIQAAVDANYLVRTRADSELDPDPARLQAALDSGAHVISTDLPGDEGDGSYFVEIPGGNPSRCNPRTAPAACTSEDIEDL